MLIANAGQKARLRRAAANVLVERGYVIEERSGKGIRPGARWIAKPAGGERSKSRFAPAEIDLLAFPGYAMEPGGPCRA